MVYTASPFLGPELGPIVGGFICQNTTWRWIFYSLLIWSVVAYLAILILVPETYHPILLKWKAKSKRNQTGNLEYFSAGETKEKSILSTVAHSGLRPMQLLIYEPMCLALCTFSAIILGILYLFFEAFGIIFSRNYGFNLQEVGLTFIGLLLGVCAGLATDPLWDKHYENLVSRFEEKSSSLHPPPEYRLPPAIVGGILAPVGLFWFAWAGQSTVHWIVPIIGSSIFGMSVLLIFSGVFTFLVDTYPENAASALASNSFLRSSFAAGFPLFASQSK